MIRCTKNLPPNPILEELRVIVDEFKDIVPIITSLRNDNLKKESHWQQIYEIIGR